MKELMSQQPTSSEVSTEGAISWSNDDPYARAMGTPEYLRRVRRVGFGALPARFRRHSSTPAPQDLVLLQEISDLKAQLAAQNARMAVLDARIAQMQAFLERLMANPGMGNPFAFQGAEGAHIVDTRSSSNVRQRSSVSSRPGKHRATSEDEHHANNIAANEH